ncbi:MAG TPA: peptide ABC transporter ATP-binding protein, partial [Candidatus Latescibacteria bacterium]|nr:peptide ABC transporter ATP-binding protein [Candidatus Latescibacterota bacterium]
GVSFSIKKQETLGLIGESGCGKTTVGRTVLRAIEPTSGEIYLEDEGEMVNVCELSKQELRRFRRHMQMVFQDPYSSLNARMTVFDIVAEPLVVNKIARGTELEDRVSELLRVVGLDPQFMRRYPHAFSGGQRQRIGVARALALNPKLIIGDEPVSALDVSVQAQVLNLLQELQERMGLTYLFISHDLAVVEHISDRVAIMYVGEIVEFADEETLFAAPKHPYTEALLSAVPKPDPDYKKEKIVLQGEVADPANTPAGCYFHPRCNYAQDICREESPELVNVAAGDEDPHLVRCHFQDTLNLIGIEN